MVEISVQLPAIIEEYLSYLRVVRKVALRTLEAYAGDLSKFVVYCENYGVDPETADSYQLEGFAADLSAERAAPSSVNRRLSSVRGFYRWMIRFGKRADNPCDALRNLKAPKCLPSVLWEDEMADFAALPEDKKLLWPTRDKAIIMSMYSTGLRISELVSLGMKAMARNIDSARIVGKGGKERMVFFSEEARSAIMDYLPERDAGIRSAGLDACDLEGALFVNRKGKPISVRRALDHRPLRQALRAAVRVGKEHSPAQSAAQLRDASCERRLRRAHSAGNAGPRESFHDPALRPRERRQAEESVREGASARFLNRRLAPGYIDWEDRFDGQQNSRDDDYRGA